MIQSGNWRGGPLKSTIKYGCSPKIKVLPFLDLKNMYIHLHELKRITEKQLGISNMSNVPVSCTSIFGCNCSDREHVNSQI